MSSNPKYVSARPAGREHFVMAPRGFIAIRIVQLILAVVILGLLGYGLSQVVFGGAALEIFTAVATLITTIYIIVAEFGSAKAYNYWAILALDIFLLIFWLVSFALVAAVTAANIGYHEVCDYYYCSYYGLSTTLGAILATAAGLGGIEFVLFITSLAIHSVGIHRHRAAGLRNRPVDASGNPTSTASVQMNTMQDPAVEKNQMNANVTPQQQQAAYYQQPAPSYPQHQQQMPQQTGSPAPPQQGYYQPPIQQEHAAPQYAQPQPQYQHQPQQVPQQPPYETAGQPMQYHQPQA